MHFYLNYLLVVLKNGKAGFQNLNSSLASCEQLFMALVTLGHIYNAIINKF